MSSASVRTNLQGRQEWRAHVNLLFTSIVFWVAMAEWSRTSQAPFSHSNDWRGIRGGRTSECSQGTGDSYYTRQERQGWQKVTILLENRLGPNALQPTYRCRMGSPIVSQESGKHLWHHPSTYPCDQRGPCPPILSKTGPHAWIGRKVMVCAPRKAFHINAFMHDLGS